MIMSCTSPHFSAAGEGVGHVVADGVSEVCQSTNVRINENEAERSDSIKSRCSQGVRFSPAPSIVFEYERDLGSDNAERGGAEAAVSAFVLSPAPSSNAVVRIRAGLARRTRSDAVDVSAGGEKTDKRRRQLKRKSLW